MNEQTQAKIMEYVDQIAQGLGVAADYVLTSWTKFIVMEGIVYTSLLILISVIVFTATTKCIKRASKNFTDEWGYLTILLVIVSIIVVIADITKLPTYVMQIFVPEYYIIKDVLSIVTGT